MSETTEPKPPRNQLREEAAEWFALMRGPEADTRREDFNRWLARGALHRNAYNSVAETFNLGKALKEEELLRRAEERSPIGLARTLLACAAATLFLTGGWYSLSRHYPGLLIPGEALDTSLAFEARYATGIGEIRSFTLKDGSKLTLDTNSIVLVSYSTGERNLRLMAGRARFTAAADSRPFMVRADTALIRAKDTVFDVSLNSNRQVLVFSLHGALDVQTQTDAAGASAAIAPTVMALAAGQQISADPDHGTSALRPQTGSEQWVEGVQAFNDVPLADLIAEANRYTPRPIRLAEPAIGNLHVSGTYRLQNTDEVAEKLASLLDLTMSEKADAILLGRP